jgi:hypothetical protein
LNSLLAARQCTPVSIAISAAYLLGVFRRIVSCRRWRTASLVTIWSQLTAYGHESCCAGTKCNFPLAGMAGTGIGGLAAWTPSKNMNMNAISITTTVMIDKMETYRKNALVLPRSRSPEKAKIERCMSFDKAGGMPPLYAAAL